MICTRDLSLLPPIEPLRRLCQSLAMLDAIVEPEWQFRYYSFNAQWAPGQAMASMRNGEGDAYFLLFTSEGAILKGFAHESLMSPYVAEPPRVWPGVLEEVPQAFATFLTERAFSISDTTFCIWRTHRDDEWHRGHIAFPEGYDPDGSAEMLAILDGAPETYRDWAENYYERPLDLAAVEHIYQHGALSPEVISALNGDLLIHDVAEDAAEIGY